MRQTTLFLFFGVITVSAVGTRWEELWKALFGGASPAWERVVMDLQAFDKQLLEWGMFPSGIGVGIVGLIITWLWPDILDKIAGTDAFLTRLTAVYQGNKKKFHNLLNKAYDKWRREQQNVPEKLDELIDKTLPMAPPEFISTRVSDVEKALIQLNRDLWHFCRALYKDIEDAMADDDHVPKYLTREQCGEFTEARKKLADFWNYEGRRLDSSFGRLLRWWTLPRIDEQLRDRSLVILPFLEAALAENISRGVAAIPLFKLSARAFKLWHEGDI